MCLSSCQEECCPGNEMENETWKKYALVSPLVLEVM